MPDQFDLNSHFEEFKDHLFFDDFTYADLLRSSAHFSKLFSRCTSDIIALKFKSSYLLMAALLGAIHANKLAVLISSLETDESIERLRSQIAFENIFTDADFEKSLQDISFEKIDENKAVVVVFSSGSTNHPKGVAISFGNLFYSAKGFADFFCQTSSDVSLLNLPHHHVGGLMTLWRAFLTGSSLISSASKKYDFVSVVPLQLSRALNDKASLEQLKQCRAILVGGAKLTDELKISAKENGLKLYETYGMSESTSLVCINGVALPYREVELDDDGFFLIKGRILALGYFIQNQFHPIHKDKGGWFRTNDIGVKSTEGKFQFSHRADLIFISGGENINPLWIEEVIRQHPSLNDAYVVPIEDERWGEMGVMLYEAKDNSLTEEKLKQFLKSKLHPHHVPKKFYPLTLKFEGQLKPKRSDLKKIANETYLKNIFSHAYIERENAPLIIFFHGFTGSKEDFYSLGEEFKKTYSLLFIDLPGHGLTKADEFFSTRDVLKKLSLFIRLFSQEPIFYGYSMGGRIALQLSLHYLLPKKLILESAGPGLATEEECKKRREKDLLMFDGFSSTENFLEFWYKNDLFKNYRESKTYKNDIQKKSSHDLSEWKKSQLTLSQGCFPLQKDNLSAMQVAAFPVYYLYGSADLKYKAYAPLFPNSYEIADASHNPHKTHPAEMTAILKKILK